MTLTDISKFLDMLAEKLGPLGTHVWELAVRQCIVEGVTSLIMTLAVLIGTLLLLRQSQKLYKQGSEEEEELGRATANSRDLKETGIIIGGVAVIVGVVGVMLFGAGALNNLLNPEWAALTKLLQTIK